MGDARELIDIQKCARILRVRYLVCDTPESGVVVETTRPYLSSED
jgi:hypothetical protein